MPTAPAWLTITLIVVAFCLKANSNSQHFSKKHHTSATVFPVSADRLAASATLSAYKLSVGLK